MERVEQRIVVQAGQAVDGVDAVGDQRLDRRCRRAHPGLRVWACRVAVGDFPVRFAVDFATSFSS